MARYASGTTVPVEKTKMEVERLLMNRGATSCHSGWTPEFASIGFTMKGTNVMVGVPLPDKRKLSPSRWDAECRRRWRCLLLILKAKFEAIESGISTIEREFLSDIVLPNGQTLGTWAVPLISEIQSGRLLLPARGEGS